MTQISATLKINDPDPNEGSRTSVLQQVADYLEKNATVFLDRSEAPLTFIWMSADDPPSELIGIPIFRLGPEGNIVDIEFYNGGEYRPLIGLLGTVTYRLDTDVSLPWEILDPGNSFESGDDTYVACRYVGYAAGGV